MRPQLADHNGKRLHFCGIFARFGLSHQYRHRTVLLTDVTHDGEPVADHLWLDERAFRRLHLQPGDVVQFRAHVVHYKKGYRGTRPGIARSLQVDYALSHPTDCRKLEPSFDLRPGFIDERPSDMRKEWAKCDYCGADFDAGIAIKWSNSTFCSFQCYVAAKDEEQRIDTERMRWYENHRDPSKTDEETR